MKLKRNIRKGYHLLKYYGVGRLIYSAGMPRSGSTILFNILKEILIQEYTEDKLAYGWIEDVAELPKKPVYLIKTHGLHRYDAIRAHRIFYSYRDLRDVMVSRLRKFNAEPTMDIARYYIRQYHFARKHASLVLKYESMIKDVPTTVKKIADVLNTDLNTGGIISRLPDINNINVSSEKHDEKTLLHKNHATHTKQGEWKDLLPSRFLDELHNEFQWWFEENKYE